MLKRRFELKRARNEINIKRRKNMIRRAETKDIEKIIGILLQVGDIHHKLRPDLFKEGALKYNADELKDVIKNDDSPVFVFEDGDEVLGYAFCVIRRSEGHPVLCDVKTLYIDDVCVEESSRGKHVGTALFEHIKRYAKENGFYNIYLNVWAGNEAAIAFYKKQGMKVQRTFMEYIL